MWVEGNAARADLVSSTKKGEWSSHIWRINKNEDLLIEGTPSELLKELGSKVACSLL